MKSLRIASHLPLLAGMHPTLAQAHEGHGLHAHSEATVAVAAALTAAALWASAAAIRSWKSRRAIAVERRSRT